MCFSGHFSGWNYLLFHTYMEHGTLSGTHHRIYIQRGWTLIVWSVVWKKQTNISSTSVRNPSYGRENFTICVGYSAILLYERIYWGWGRLTTLLIFEWVWKQKTAKCILFCSEDNNLSAWCSLFGNSTSESYRLSSETNIFAFLLNIWDILEFYVGIFYFNN